MFMLLSGGCVGETMLLFRLLLLAEPAQLPLAPDASMSLPAGRDSLDRRKLYLEQTANWLCPKHQRRANEYT